MATSTVATFKSIFDANTQQMANGLRNGSQALRGMAEESEDLTRELRQIPNDVNIDVDANTEGATAKMRAWVLAERAKLQNAIEVDVDIDMGAAVSKMFALERELKRLDRMDVRPEVHVDTDMGAAGALAAAQGLRAIGSAGPIAAGGLAVVAASAAALVGPAALGGLIAAITGAGGYGLLSAYDELEKGNKRFSVVFGDQADEIDAWARTLSSRVGVGVEELKGMASGIQDILVPIGFNRSQAADITQDLYERGAALAEFTGKDVDVAVDAMTKALVGERESLKQFGVVLKQSQVDSRAETLKGTDAARGLDDEQLKALATLELIEEQSKDAFSAYEDGTNTAGQSLNVLAAKFATAKDDIILGLGQIAVSIIEDLDFGDMTEGLDSIPEWIKAHSDEIRAFMLDLAILAISGAEAFLDLGLTMVEMFSTSAPMMAGLTKIMGNMAVAVGAVAAGVAAITMGPGAAKTIIDTALAARELAYGSADAGEALAAMGPEAVAGLEAAKDQLGGVKAELEGLRDSDDVRVKVGVEADKGNWKEVQAGLAGMSKTQVARILTDLPKDNLTKNEKILRALAKARKIELKAELKNEDQVERELERISKDRYTKIWASWGWSTSDSGIPLFGGIPRQQQSSVVPGPQPDQSTTMVVNVNGRQVAQAVSREMNTGHREVWV